VAPADRALFRQLLRRLATAGRLDPMAVHIDHKDGGRVLVLVGGCSMPSLPGKVFVTVTLVPAALAAVDRPRDEGTGLLTKDALLDLARLSSPGPSPRRLTLVSLEGLSAAASVLPPDRANLLMEEIGASLRARSMGGDTAGRLAKDEFGFVSAGPADASHQTALVRDLQGVIDAAGIDGKRIGPRSVQIDLAAGGMNEQEAAKSLTYAVASFTRTHGRNFTLSSLQAGLAAAMADTAARFGVVRRIIDQELFTLVFQPVVSFDTRQVHHYEALSRFPGGQSPFEIITFSEEIGLVEELDLAVCRRAIEVIEEVGASIAVNISGRSVQNARFRDELSELVRPQTHLGRKLLFELTESSAVDDLDDAAGFLRWLRKLGFQVCLDDFGAGAAAYSYLRRFDVDFVKIDGPFLKAAKTQKRERALIGSVARLCQELECAVIGEMIEDEDMVEVAHAMGVRFGQGWLFGKPLERIPPPMVGRRKGSAQSWS
jgi:EAL domain-containing protein (putative c-di-GMP-specific phosphodiesterase class I)